MKAATVRVCAAAVGDEAVMGQRVGIAMKMLRGSGGGHAPSGNVIGIVGIE